MKIKEVFKVEGKENYTGVNERGEWSFDEYIISNKLEMEDGLVVETNLPAAKASSVEELQVGSVYKMTVFVTSRESGGKHYPKFRITNADIVSGAEKIESTDGVPF